MKRLLKIALSILLLLFLVSCNLNEPDTPQDVIKKIDEQKELFDEDLLFSLDKGETFQIANNEVDAFEIVDVNDEDMFGVVFFYATSYQELEEQILLKKESNTHFYIKSDINWDMLLEQYDEAYFDDNILLFYYKYEPNISKNYAYNVVVENDELTLNINRFEGMDTALSSWVEHVTIKKLDVEYIERFKVSVRTIIIPPSQIIKYIQEDYIRQVYIHGLQVSDFKDLDNLLDIWVFTFGLHVDVIFGIDLSNDQLMEVKDYLESADTVLSVGATSNQKIRINISGLLYDKFMDQSLAINDIFKESTIDTTNFKLNFITRRPVAYVVLYLEKHGTMYLNQMIDALNELDLPCLVPSHLTD